MRRFGIALIVLWFLAPLSARAELWQAPVGGQAIDLGSSVACDTPTGGWTLEGGKRALRPPVDERAIGTLATVRVAPNAAACAQQAAEIRLVATGRRPLFDPDSIVFWPDEGRLEAHGRNLEGALVVWREGQAVRFDTCRGAHREGGVERCEWAAGRGLAAEPTHGVLFFMPAGALPELDSAVFDLEANLIPQGRRVLLPARILLTAPLASDAAVDLASGQGEVPLNHPEAVASVECSAVRCDLVDGRVVARGVSSLVSSTEVRVRLLPRVFFARKEGVEKQAVFKLPVLHCAMAIASGPAVRSNDDAKLVLKLEGGCAREFAALRFVSEARPLKVLKSVQYEGATYVLLRLGRIEDDSVTVTAQRGDIEPLVLGVAHIGMRSAPDVRASLELPGYPNLGFIPNNVPATVHVSMAGERQRFALLPVDGVYSVPAVQDGFATVLGDPHAAGLAQLRFGLRSDDLPPGLKDADLAVVTDPLQRAVREANLPAPIAATSPGALVELLCGGGSRLQRILPGSTAHLDFELRDTCRVIFHRERLPAELGTQKLNFEVEVIRADGTSRGEARVSEVVTLRSGKQPREAWIRGVVDPFDRIAVRVSHVADEVHYVGGAELRTGAPEAQWSAILGTGRARLYATSTIPTGLYRFGDKDHSGVLSLNFGVISRLTWLDAEGHEGFLGAEAGVLVFGLANSTSQTGQSLTQVGAVLGLGVAVPIANRSSISQASINLHAWLEADITGGDSSSSRYAFLFGPSISIGNVGTNL